MSNPLDLDALDRAYAQMTRPLSLCVVRQLDGNVRIDDAIEDAPFASMHQGSAEQAANAHAIVALVNAYPALRAAVRELKRSLLIQTETTACLGRYLRKRNDERDALRLDVERRDRDTRALVDEIGRLRLDVERLAQELREATQYAYACKDGRHRQCFGWFGPQSEPTTCDCDCHKEDASE